MGADPGVEAQVKSGKDLLESIDYEIRTNPTGKVEYGSPVVLGLVDRIQKLEHGLELEASNYKFLQQRMESLKTRHSKSVMLHNYQFSKLLWVAKEMRGCLELNSDIEGAGVEMDQAAKAFDKLLEEID